LDAVEKIPLIALAGSTASGKTGLAVSLCEAFGGEVVSCDSMQVYRGMPIATAQPGQAEMRGVPYHLIGFLPPGEPFSVVDYCELARQCIADIHDRGKLPVLAGGTGLYFHALLDNIRFIQTETDRALREKLYRRAESEGAQALLDELRGIDPVTAEALHVNNLGRIVRALEIWESSGEKPSAQKAHSRLEPSPYASCRIGLDARDREVLYERINRRVDIMLAQGLVEEARWFFSLENTPTAGQAIGYKELRPYLEGQLSLEQAAENLKRETRRYAKRQLTWLRRDETIHWLYIDNYEDSHGLFEAAKELATKFMDNL